MTPCLGGWRRTLALSAAATTPMAAAGSPALAHVLMSALMRMGSSATPQDLAFSYTCIATGSWANTQDFSQVSIRARYGSLGFEEGP